MKILFKIIKTGSGNDIYFKILEGLKTQGIKITTCYYPTIFQFFPFFLKFINKAITADIIHSNIEYGWVFKRKNVPLVVIVHHLVFEKKFQEYTSFSQKLFHYLIVLPNTKKSLQVADKIIAVSKYTQKSVYRVFGKQKQVDVIYNGINLNIFKPIQVKAYNDNKFHLLFVGNLIKRKGIDILLKIMKVLGNNYVLYYTSGLRTKTSSKYNLPNMISLGKLSEEELVKKYNECDALLAPSRLEGFGHQIAEAMACGKPVITTNCSALPELIIDKKGGFLCKIDNVNDFVEKIKILSENKYLVEKMGQFNRQRAIENFNLKKMEKEYQQLYSRLLLKW